MYLLYVALIKCFTFQQVSDLCLSLGKEPSLAAVTSAAFGCYVIAANLFFRELGGQAESLLP